MWAAFKTSMVCNFMEDRRIRPPFRTVQVGCQRLLSGEYSSLVCITFLCSIVSNLIILTLLDARTFAVEWAIHLRGLTIDTHGLVTPKSSRDCSHRLTPHDFQLCTCGMTLADNAPLVSDSMCNATCPGNSSETCGGPYYSSVWTIPTADLPNQSTTYNLGCYVSPSAAATTPGLIMASSYNWQSGSMTTEACVSGCLGFGYGWAATSYGSR